MRSNSKTFLLDQFDLYCKIANLILEDDQEEMVEHDDLEDEHEEIDDTEVVNIDEESDNICDDKYQDQENKRLRCVTLLLSQRLNQVLTESTGKSNRDSLDDRPL